MLPVANTIPQRLTPFHPGGRHRALVQWIWLYFWLLIFEGALRKWFLPGFSNLLLVVRDPVALVILAKAWSDRVEFPKGVVGFLYITGILFGFFGLLHIATGLITPKVFLFGMRTYFLHLPLVFVIGKVLNADDVRRIVRWLLVVSVPMTVLMAYQFLSPADAWINKGVGEEGSQLLAARDHIRAAGTFSFISGPIAFYSLVLACCLAEFFGTRRRDWNISHAALASTILVSATAGSRALVVSLGIVMAMMLLCMLLKSQSFTGGAKALGVTALAVVALTFTNVFQEGVMTLTERTMGAGDAEGGATGFLMRIVGGLTGPMWAGMSVPIYGAGVGLGTNVGAALASGEVGFLMSEGEWGRVFCEVGFLGGLLYIGFRTWLVIWLGLRGWRMAKRGNVLPFLLFGAAAPQVWNGQWGVATSLGFAVFTGGLAVAAGNPGVANLPGVQRMPRLLPHSRRRRSAIAVP